MSKTEGPWKIAGVEGYWSVRHDNPCGHWSGFTERTEAEAKALELNKLEAVREAAPELLEVCKTLLNVFPVAVDDIIVEGLHDMARAAIAKAEQV